MDMLNAKKVKLHGMKDIRWTTKDKITQYKGLINLYKRDKKVTDFDTFITRKKFTRQIKHLHKDIKGGRAELENAIQGDHQLLRNTLAEHRAMQLAYQTLHPIKVIEHVHQDNFLKRKELDRTKYKIQQKMDRLINLKLDISRMEDLLIVGTPGKLPIEMRAQIITGRVQDAILKQDAALTVRQTYQSILEILRKDALYFDAVLLTLKQDGFNQSKCLINTTQMGQLATEYLNDRELEFHELEKTVKVDMKERIKDLNVIRVEADDIVFRTKFLIRRDSDINLGVVRIEDTPSETCLHEDIVEIEDILIQIKSFVLVPAYENIYPCLIEQRRQAERMKSFLETLKDSRDKLLNKLNHAELQQQETLLNNVWLFLDEYRDSKTQLKRAIKEEIHREKVIKKTIEDKSQMTIKLRIAVQQLSAICENIVLPNEAISRRLKKKALEYEEIIDKDHEDMEKVINNVATKLTALVAHDQTDKKISNWIDAEKFLQQLVSTYGTVLTFEEVVIEESLVDQFMMEDSQVPNRNDIKQQSAEIVQQFNINPDLIPIFQTKKRYKSPSKRKKK